MTTYFPFTPSNLSTPQFLPTFDGQQYQVNIVWSLFGQRYYVMCRALDGALIYNQALVESTPGLPIQAMAWNIQTKTVNGSTQVPHGYRLGMTINLTVSAAAPGAYNGLFKVLITGPSSFSYPLSLDLDPGPTTTAGILSYNINMNGAYFESSLVFRNQNFEVNP